HDALTYDALGWNLAAGHGYVLEPGGPPTALRGPVYPLFLAGVYALFGHRYGAVYAAQVLVDMGALALTYALAWQVYRRREVATLAAVGYALYLPFALQVGQVMTETVFTALLLLGIWAFFAAVDRAPGWRAAGLQGAAGVALGLASLTRPAGLVVAGSLAVALCWLVRPWKRAVLQGAALLVAFGLVLLPWTWRNWALFGVLVPTSTLGGVNLYIGNYSLEREAYLAAHSAEETRRMLILTRALEMERAPWMNEAQLDLAFRERALALIRAHPWRYVHLSANRFLRLWFNLGYAGQWPSAATWALAGGHALFLALAARGLWREGTEAARRAWALVAVLVAFTLFHMAILAYVRFLFPVVPLVLVLAARGAWRLLGREGA
ncbi:MAG: glycosyltransferase family 39 protein, partial [Anaerolineae bacterium]|nr:glycosyltransferase family 39 protein [Anaerolineae bacterium]